jgi:hypothetical protein
VNAGRFAGNEIGNVQVCQKRGRNKKAFKNSFGKNVETSVFKHVSDLSSSITPQAAPTKPGISAKPPPFAYPAFSLGDKDFFYYIKGLRASILSGGAAAATKHKRSLRVLRG